MNKCYSTVELSKALGVSARAVTKRAHLEKWKFNNGKRRAYIFQSLPQEVRRKIISKQAGVAIDFVPAKNLDISFAEAGLKKWNKATKYNRKLAQARDHILNRLSEFIETKNLAQGLGEERFASFYNAGLIKDVAPWVIDKISTVSAPTLRRWRGDSEKNGLPGLLGGYGNRKGQRKAVTSEQSAFIISHIKSLPHIRGEHIFKMICKTFETHPARRTVYRFINDWKEKNSELFALSEDPRRWKNSYMAAFGDASADVPFFGHTVEMDSTPADAITKDGRRLAVIGAIDIFSRRAIILLAPTSKSVAIAACMRKAMLTWGIFSRARKDNGKDYQSSHVDAITSALKIETPELPKYSPEKKPYIERFFGTFSRGLEELLPGYCGHLVNERMALREKETWAAKIMKPGGVAEIPLAMEEFQSLADRWIEIYERTPHKGLGGKTPLQAAKESRLQPPKIRDERILDILLAPAGFRRVQKQGISVDGSFFVSPELIEYIGRRVEIRRDLNNAGLLYVFDASTGKYLCQAKNEPLEGHKLEAYLAAKKKHFKGLREQSRALDKMGLSNRTPIQILLEGEIEHVESNVIPFQGNFENQAVREAKKAVEDIDIEQIDEAPDQVARAVNYYPSMDFLLTDEHMTAEDLDREFEEMKKHHDKRMWPSNR